ncbi:ASCH domain-containing protein [Clostridium septicum]|uniref:ASCH domain-containing protein n=1 Tax=Clostridium septicum TaxID=1504 RepID=A0A9N7PLQ2_CLOSE|nr:ASCH domain-containing protein [Clostridium septicum]AYE35712.1 hypothetical protein CP523_15430 [Clostridium septicum]UEC19612.1 hypothetical protein LK444_09270 [Clostridium septicum]USS02327.1 hypothetical protein NH397_07905 [Clostridium septicum]
MKVLLSIKPQYVQRIFNGEKKFEYRKTLFKRKDIDSILVYATKPIGKVVGEFKIGTIIEDSPEFIWELTKNNSGIKRDDYEKYFEGRSIGFAISIKKPKIYKTPLELSELNPNIKVAPQSFMYI